MASLMTKSKWIKFFEDAGLPSSVATSYAVLFSEHRIQMDMLLDLSKEYLYDMGIHVMGDVIAILRHAKIAHAQQAKEKMMEEMQAVPANNSKITATNRILDRYTRRANNDSTIMQPSGAISNRYGGATLASEKDIKGKNTIISLKRKQTVDVPVKKIRRILSEHEDTYSIKMSSGTTVKTRKILQQQSLQPVKKSVFDRLGDSVVSSSTDVVKTKSTSVFERLGPVKPQGSSEVAPSSVRTDVEDEGLEAPLQYQGVLKTSAIKPISFPRTVNLSKIDLKTPQTYTPFSGRSNILKRLGPKPSSPVSTTSENVPTTTNNIRKPTIDSFSTRRRLVSSRTEGILAGVGKEFGYQSVKTRLGQKVSPSSTISGAELRRIHSSTLLCAAAGNIVARAKATAAARTAKRTI